MDLYKSTPRDLGIPLDSWRAGQPETVIKILTTPKKFVLLEAPTGSGKSAIALAVAAMLARDSEKTFITTATKELQDQYLSLGHDIGVVKVMGRSNYPCHIDSAITAAHGDCTMDIPCSYAGTGPNSIHGCDYYGMLKEALASNISLFNIAYLTAERQYVGRFQGAEVLFIDEAHDLREQITKAATVEFRGPAFTRAGISFPPLHDNLGAWLAWALDAESNINTRINYLIDLGSDRQEDKTQLRSLSSIQRTIHRLLLPAQYIARPLSHEHVQFVPTWPAPFTDSLLFSAAKKTVFMTATPGDPATFAAALGIDKNDMEVIRLSSTFHPSRRPLNYWPQGRVAGNNPDTWQPLLAAIAHILDHNPDGKGLICCVSYKLGAWLANHLRPAYGSRILFPSSESKKEELARFKSSKEPLVMISPSMSTGVDLPFDQCRFVVIPKLPFGDRTDPLLVARSATKLGKALSIQDTANNLVQSYGRAMRDETDWGVTWLLDGNFDWFKNAARGDLPRWFTEAIRYYRPGGDGLITPSIVPPPTAPSVGVSATPTEHTQERRLVAAVS